MNRDDILHAHGCITTLGTMIDASLDAMNDGPFSSEVKSATEALAAALLEEARRLKELAGAS